MAPMRVRATASTFSSRVTLYEPSAPAAGSSLPPSSDAAAATSDLASTRGGAPAIAPSLTPRRSSRLSGVKLEGEEELFKPSWEGDDEVGAEEVKPSPSPIKGKASRSPRKPKKHVEALEKPHPAPKRWEETYEVIRKQRQTCVFASLSPRTNEADLLRSIRWEGLPCLTSISAIPPTYSPAVYSRRSTGWAVSKAEGTLSRRKASSRPSRQKRSVRTQVEYPHKVSGILPHSGD